MRVTPLLLMMALTGCAAHSSALRQGDRAARHGSWDVAVERYEQAAAISPDNTRVQERLTGAQASLEADRKRRLDAAVADLERAVLSGDWENARAAVSRARAVEPVIADALALDAFETLAPAVRRHLAQDQLRQAWPKAMVAVMVYPEQAAYSLLSDVRRACSDRVDALAQRGDWADAIAWLDWMGEQGVEGDIGARRELLLADWSSQLAVQAKVAEAGGKLARAAVLYNDAFAVDGDRNWLVERDRVTRGVEEALRYGVRWPVERGEGALAVQSLVRQTLHTDARVTLDRSDNPHMTLDLRMDPPVCDDQTTEAHERVNVKVGERDVTNPDYEPRLRALRTAERARGEAERELTALDTEVMEAERAHGAVMAYTVAPARTEQARASEQVAWAERRVMEAEDALAASRAAGAEQDDPVLTSQLALARERLEAARRAADAPERALESALAEAERAARHLSGVQDKRMRARRELDDAVATVQTRTRTLDRTPMTVREDILEPFVYPVSTTTRTCMWTARLDQRGIQGTEQTAWSVTEVTRDAHHLGYPEAGVLMDPLLLPRSDAQLQVAAEQAVAEAVTAHVSGKTRAYYAHLWDDALRTSTDDVAAALDHWLAVLRLDPVVADATGLAALRSRAGDIDWMRH